MSGSPIFQVEIEQEAEADLRAIALYLHENISADSADQFLVRTLDRIATLEQFPHRGSVPKELEKVGRRDFRQLVAGVNRIFYKVIDRRVIIVLVADGRRDIDALLAERLFGR